MPVEFSKNTYSATLLEDDPLHWTRCTVKGGAKYDKDAVLDAIIMRIGCVTILLPCLYQKEGKDSFFIFRHGKQAIKRIIEGLWCINDPTGRIEELLEVSFVLEYLTTEEEPYDPFKNLEEVVLKRTNSKENVIDLRNLQNDTDLKNVYVSFHSPKLLAFIGALVKIKHPNFQLNALILSHNCLEQLDMMCYLKAHYDKVNTLDLRHNKLPNAFRVKHLLVEGNPMCDEYESAGETICKIADKFSSLERIDSVEINYIQDFPQKKANLKLFIRNPTYSELVDHFLHHYFMLFENDRKKLVHTYHKNASLSVSVFRHELSIVPPVPAFFALSNRNIMSMSDITKTYDNIYVGKVRVLEALESMPKMKFDFHTFSVDVPVTAKGELVVISCSGCFCLPEEELSRKYSLSRICVLCPLKNGLGEWLILNDMWTISSISPKALSSAEFSLTRSRDVASDFAVMLNPFLKDKAILISVASKLTHMKAAWVEKFLSESGWDLEMTLLAFTHQFKANKIPSDAFSARPRTIDGSEEIGEDLEQDQQAVTGSETEENHELERQKIVTVSTSIPSWDPAMDPLEGISIDEEALSHQDVDQLNRPPANVDTSAALKREDQQQGPQQSLSLQVHRTQHHVAPDSSRAMPNLARSALSGGAKNPPLSKARHRLRKLPHPERSEGPLLHHQQPIQPLLAQPQSAQPLMAISQQVQPLMACPQFVFPSRVQPHLVHPQMVHLHPAHLQPVYLQTIKPQGPQPLMSLQLPPFPLPL